MVQVADRSAAQVFLTELVERPLLPSAASSLVKLTFDGGATGFGVAESLNAITAVLGGFIMSLYMLGTMGTTPIGGLITGWITDQRSPRASLAVAGFTPLVCAAFVLGGARRIDRQPVIGLGATS